MFWEVIYLHLQASPFHNEMKVKDKELEPCYRLQQHQQQPHLQELFQPELFTLMAIHIQFAFEMSFIDHSFTFYNIYHFLLLFVFYTLVRYL